VPGLSESCVSVVVLVVARSEDIFGKDVEALAIFSHVLAFDIARHGLAHIQRALTQATGWIGWIVGVVVHDGAKSRIAHAFVHADGVLVALADEEIHEPRFLGIAGPFERLREQLAVA
jgi:hypothetical protein